LNAVQSFHYLRFYPFPQQLDISKRAEKTEKRIARAQRGEEVSHGWMKPSTHIDPVVSDQIEQLTFAAPRVDGSGEVKKLSE